MVSRVLSRLSAVVIAVVLVGSVAPWLTSGARAASGAVAVPPGSHVRAMWLWTRSEPVNVINWAQAHGVREIFAYVAPDVESSGDLPRLQELKTRADAAGIVLSALGGDPGWVFDPYAALAWQRSALATGLFAGSHVDVEPYALSAWITDQPSTIAAYLSMLDLLQDDDARPMEVDVPFWYDGITTFSGNLAQDVIGRADAVTVMTYRDTATGANSMTAIGADMLNRGAAAGKPVRLAAETQHLPDCLHCTFYEEGKARMTSVLNTVDSIAQSYSSFNGIAVHHYGSWLALRP
jgi:hypothetical protein